MSDAPSASSITEQHRWLDHFLGDWTFETGQGEDRSQGMEAVRRLGDQWIITEGVMPSGAYLSVVGFDPAKGRFIGQWVGSMMSHAWIYDGELSPDRRALLLFSEGPAADGSDRMQTYRDTFEITSLDERIQRGACLDENGDWNELYVTTLRRKGAAL
ncbi:DUF1579 domain-containing protein [Brevundimonas sp. S30B]|uniref:DUF1579 family protein n=1 Tax=unclassified Brevundimonas TaxID=2622653 RepID=UPI0010722A09|nr:MULTISPECIES: DUF1579 family protein [unclassified Brevundimonas]QBX36873.1 DUF1579 domain-containing protein [Brevundimonas sp. MF30-B]TFW04332.1 DUF1579 domain-containing protein [Brevundimonas sp. S30B]